MTSYYVDNNGKCYEVVSAVAAQDYPTTGLFRYTMTLKEIKEEKKEKKEKK